MKIRTTMPFALLLLTAGCGRDTSHWTPTKAEDALVADKRPVAERARDALAGQLKAELTKAIGEGGPAAAVNVCSQRARAIAADVAAAQGVRIGRSSARLRNPDNIAPEWARGAISDPKAAAEPRFFKGPANELGALFPIVLQPQCVVCHGDKQQIAPAVQAALAVHYPFDRATGFSPGDLRGWFWVEVP